MKFVHIFVVILGFVQSISAYICARDLYSGNFQNFPSIQEMKYQNLQGARKLLTKFKPRAANNNIFTDYVFAHQGSCG